MQPLSTFYGLSCGLHVAEHVHCRISAPRLEHDSLACLVQAAGDAEFDLVQSMVRNMDGEDDLQEEGGLVKSLAGDVEEASSLEDVQSKTQASELTKNQVK